MRRRVPALMSSLAALAVPAALLVFAVCAGPATAAEPLAVCMAEDSAPLSYAVAGEPRGLDVRLAQAIADALGRPLRVLMFESKYEQESTLSQEVNALLASGVCELASGFSLIAGDLGPPSRPTARVPDYPGAPRRAARPWVPLKALRASHAYQASALALVIANPNDDPALKLASPADARLQRIGAATGTLAGTALTMYRRGALRPKLVSLSRGDEPLAMIEAGRLDATLLPLGRLDAWRLAHPATPLRAAGWLHPWRMNLGFVGLAENAAVLTAADGVIDRAIASGDLPRWAAQSGTSWVAPAAPQLAPAFRMQDLAID